MATNSAGQVLIDVTSFPDSEKPVAVNNQRHHKKAPSVSSSIDGLGSRNESNHSNHSNRKKVTLKDKELSVVAC